MKRKCTKKLISFMVIFIALFMFSGNVEAKDCTYYSHATLGPSENINVTVNMDGSKPKAVINSYYESYDMNNSESIQNWSDIKSTYAETTTCPTYIMVTKGITGYNVYLSYDENELSEIATKKDFLIGSKEAIVTHCSNEYTAPASNENYYKNVEEKTTAILSAADNFNINECKDNGKVITRISECRKLYNSANMFLNSSESEIRGLIASGDISADDPRVKAFFEALEKAKKQWEQAEEQINKEQRKIDEEMGTATEQETTKSSSWNSSDGNTNKFLKKIWNMLKIIVPMLVIIFSIVDFLKVLFISDEKNYKEAYTRLMWRIAIGIILFVLPAILSLLLNLAGLQDVGIFEIFS